MRRRERSNPYTPMAELDALIRAGYGRIRRDQIPPDWRAMHDAAKASRRAAYRSKIAAREAAHARGRAMRERQALRRAIYLQETGRA